MTFEASIDRLTAALEAFTGVMVTMGGTAKAAATTTTETPKTNGSAAAEPAKPRRGRPPGTTTAAKAEVVEEPFGDDDDLGGDDDDLGGDAAPAVTPEEARAAVIAYRDAAVKALGGDKDAAMTQTRAILKPITPKLDTIDDSNAAAVMAAFAAATKKLKKG